MGRTGWDGLDWDGVPRDRMLVGCGWLVDLPLPACRLAGRRACLSLGDVLVFLLASCWVQGVGGASSLVGVLARTAWWLVGLLVGWWCRCVVRALYGTGCWVQRTSQATGEEVVSRDIAWHRVVLQGQCCANCLAVAELVSFIHSVPVSRWRWLPCAACRPPVVGRSGASSVVFLWFAGPSSCPMVHLPVSTHDLGGGGGLLRGCRTIQARRHETTFTSIDHTIRQLYGANERTSSSARTVLEYVRVHGQYALQQGSISTLPPAPCVVGVACAGARLWETTEGRPSAQV